MAGQIQLTFLLAIVVCMVYGAPPSVIQHLGDEEIEIRADLDNTVDALLPTIRKLILKYGMDPMKITDISKAIFPHLPGKLKGNIDLTEGWMQNLSLIKRTEHITAIYKDKRLTLDMNLGFDVMDFDYSYYLRYLLYKRQGDVYGRLYELDVNVVMTIDLNEYNLSLDSIKFSDVQKFDIKLEGHILDSIVNAVTKIITTVFRNTVLSVMEDYGKLVFGAKIEEWNTKIPRANRKYIIQEWLDIVKIPA
ncbi:uncharacterized protein LOC105839868 [Monomorium pharaonis]|uniref:uncharacterized protein LOC105839868 n=1 Tax=Monomorium pharaonis TaxID=307658 RepID=UPI00063FC1E6|nr:uncharacterized protein LOC105839868 [Monomorium pharaonis]